MALLRRWELQPRQKTKLLGLAPGRAGAIYVYSRGLPLPPRKELLERVGHLLAIHRTLRSLWPRNRELIYGWINARNSHFDGSAPADHGIEGLRALRVYLEGELCK